MRGLLNSGNACYLNAALQCLLHTPPLANYFMSDCAQEDASRRRVNARAVAAEFAALARAMWRPADPPPDEDPAAALDPAGVLAALAKVHRAFGNRTMQHDAHEALMALLGTLHDAQDRTPRLVDSPAERHVHLESWAAHTKGKGGYSFLTEVFQGQMRVRVTGPGYSSTTYEHFWDLSLAVDGRTSSVQQAIARHLEPAVIDGYKHGDDDEARLITVDVRREFTHTPLVLVAHLKRFDAALCKLDKFVDYTVDMDVPLAGGQTAQYTLFAVCMHSGAVAGGHYTAMCEAGGRWTYIDDAAARPVDDLNSLIQKDAYMLLYRRRGDLA
jgi:ubiquitin C-terminal hydrolase